MTPEEFDAAAHQLLTAEQDGSLRLPMQLGNLAAAVSGSHQPSSGGRGGGRAGGGAGRGQPRSAQAEAAAWGDDVADETVPLRSQHFNDQPAAPSRRRRGGGPGDSAPRGGRI